MKRKAKMLFSPLIIALFILGMVACVSSGAPHTQIGEEGLVYNLRGNDSYAVVKYQGKDDVIVIPETVNGKYVTSIGSYAFFNCSGLTSITIPDSVTSIGERAFRGCTGLTSVTIGNGVTSIGSYAFGACSNLQYNEYDNGYYLGNNTHPYFVFVKVKNKDITSIDVADTTKIIYQSAFRNCTGLTSVTIGNGVTSIGDYAFYGCYRLVEVYNKSFLNITKGSEDNGYVGYYAKDIYTAPYTSKLSTDSNGYILYTDGDVVSLIGYTGTDTTLTLPQGITEINQSAFRNCTGLTSITIPDSVTSIGNYAFVLCYKLVEVYNKSSLNITKGNSDYGYVGYYAKDIYTIPYTSKLSTDSNEYILYTDGDVVSLIGYTGTDTELTLPQGITEINQGAFYGCKGLTSITIPDSITSIGSYAFGCSGLTSITIPDSVTSIGDGAFSDCTGLTSITIPDSVTSIGEGAFYGCSGLTSVTIPDSVTSIGSSAFEDCNGLTKVYYTGDIASWCGIKFGDYSANPLYYAHDLYINNELVTEIEIPDTVTKINDFAFLYCTGLTSVTIGNSVTSIGMGAFFNCSGFTSITYRGTEEQWNAIEKGFIWDTGTGDYIIYCLDGDIQK